MYSVVLKVPQLAGAFGGVKRAVPVGAAAKGIPRNLFTAILLPLGPAMLVVVPTILPLLIDAVGVALKASETASPFTRTAMPKRMMESEKECISLCWCCKEKIWVDTISFYVRFYPMVNGILGRS